jgi:hypothetical protein
MQKLLPHLETFAMDAGTNRQGVWDERICDYAVIYVQPEFAMGEGQQLPGCRKVLEESVVNARRAGLADLFRAF